MKILTGYYSARERMGKGRVELKSVLYLGGPRQVHGQDRLGIAPQIKLISK